MQQLEAGARIAMLLFPHMLPMADFPEAKCDVLRRVVVARLERIGSAHLGLTTCGLWGDPG